MFGVKYLTKGIEYTRLKADDWVDRSIKVSLYTVLLGYLIFFEINMIFLASSYPVFKPQNVTSALECDRLFSDYVVRLAENLATTASTVEMLN